jgi:hypothetical protein
MNFLLEMDILMIIVPVIVVHNYRKLLKIYLFGEPRRQNLAGFAKNQIGVNNGVALVAHLRHLHILPPHMVDNWSHLV